MTMGDHQRLSNEKRVQYFRRLWRFPHRLYELFRVVYRAQKIVDERMSREPPNRGPSNVREVNFQKRSPPNPPGPPPNPPDSPRRWQPAAIVLLAGLALMVAAGHLGSLLNSSLLNSESAGTTYETAANESRTQQLEDGTVVSLGAQSKLRINFTNKRRVVQQLQGEATFDVAEDAARPFIVSTFLVDLAQGTKFAVFVDTSVTVAVHDGIVKVLGRGPKPGTQIEVKAGTSYRVPVGRLRTVLAGGGLQRMHECGA